MAASPDFFPTIAAPPKKPTNDELLARMTAFGTNDLRRSNTLELPSAGAPELRVGPLSSPPGVSMNIDRRLINAVIGTESGGNPNARGKAGEVGLMQIMPSTARRMGVPVEALNDPNVNVQTGTRLLNQLMTKYHGDIYKTLAAYNAGEGAVDRGQIPASTQRYVDNVLRRVGGNMPTIASDPQGSMRTPVGITPSFLARLQGAWGPGTAEAAEPPSAADIARDKARRAGTPITGPIGGPPSTGGPPSAADIAADKARRAGGGVRVAPPGTAPAPDEANAPWPVRAAGYLPAAGQMLGDWGVSTAAAPLAVAAGPGALPVEMGAGAIGSGGGYALGEIPNRAVRSWYGYPNPTWSQEKWQTGEAAALGAAGAPILRVAKALSPSSLKAGIEAIPQFGAAQQATKDVTEQVSKRLGVTIDEAKEIAANSQAIKQLPGRAEGMLNRVERLPQAARERGMQALRHTIGAYVHEASSYGANSLQQLMRMKSALRSIPDRVFYRLYNASRGELEELIDTALREHEKFLKYPQLSQAIKATLDQAPSALRNRVYHHFGWLLSPFGVMYAMRGQVTHAVEVMGIGASILAGSAVVNSPVARKIYLRLLLSKTAPEAILLTKALLATLGTMSIRAAAQPDPDTSGEGAPEEAPPEAPAPAAAPSAVARAELPPAPPSDSTLEIPSAPPPAPDEGTE